MAKFKDADLFGLENLCSSCCGTTQNEMLQR